MAIYHLHVQIIKRSSGRSSVSASAYRAGEKIHNEYDGITHDYRRKSGVVHSEIMLPQNAPKEFQDRSTLWNAVEKSEKRKDSFAQFSRHCSNNSLLFQSRFFPSKPLTDTSRVVSIICACGLPSFLSCMAKSAHIPLSTKFSLT